MSFTADDILTAAQAEGYPSATTDETTQLAILNAALRELYAERRWPFMRTLSDLAMSTAVDGKVSLTAGTIAVESVRLTLGTSFYDLTHLSDIEMERRRHEDRDVGTPAYWSRIGSNLAGSGQIVVYPRPSAAVTLNVVAYIVPSLPGAVGTVVNWPDEGFNVLKFRVMMGMAARQRDWTARDRYSVDAKDALGSMYRNQQADAQNQTTLEVESVDGFSDYF